MESRKLIPNTFDIPEDAFAVPAYGIKPCVAPMSAKINCAPPVILDPIHALLDERGKTHGDYTDHSWITQSIKRVMETGRNYDKLDDHELETLDMVAHKIGRIVSGNPHFEDHWRDIAGYATLSADRNKI